MPLLWPLGNSFEIKKKAGSSFCCLKNEAKKKFSGCHLTRTQKAAGPSEESMRNLPAWTVKCKFKDVRATRRYVFNILLICGLYSSNHKVGPTNMAPMPSPTLP